MPGEECVYKIEFIGSGDLSVRPGVSKGDKSFLFVMGNFNNTYAGFENVDGQGVAGNWTKVELKLERAQRHVAVIEVYNGKLRASVDGRVVSELTTTCKEFGPPSTPQFVPKDPARLALCVWNTTSTFYQVQVVEVTGVGRQPR